MSFKIYYGKVFKEIISISNWLKELWLNKQNKGIKTMLLV